MSKEDHDSPIWLVPPKDGCLRVFASALEQHKSPHFLIREYQENDAWLRVLNKMVTTAENLLRFALPLIPAWETYEELEDFFAWMEASPGKEGFTKEDMEEVSIRFGDRMLQRCKKALQTSIVKPSEAWPYFVYTTEGRSYWEPEPTLPNDPYAWAPLADECKATIHHFLSKVDLQGEAKRLGEMKDFITVWEGEQWPA